jgi:hypothetical protein
MIRRVLVALLFALIALPVHAAGFPLKVSVQPATMPYGAYPAVVAVVSRGAACSAQVVYSTGRRPVSFHGGAMTSTGTIRWPWHEETKGNSGVATVTCRLHGVNETKTAGFVVTH